MIPFNRLPKDLQKALLAMALLYGSAGAAGCRPPIICDPAPPPSVAGPTRTPTPMICDPPPPPRVSPTPAQSLYLQIRRQQVTSNPRLRGAFLQGQVIGVGGQPLVGLKVVAQGSEARYEALTQDDGEFRVAIPRVGAYHVRVEGQQGQEVDLNLREHDLATIEWEVVPQAHAPLPLAEIRTVRITWEEGSAFAAETPWPAARYRWTVSGGDLDGDGERVSWELPDTPGRYLLQVVADWGYAGLAVDALVVVVDEDGSAEIL